MISLVASVEESKGVSRASLMDVEVVRGTTLLKRGFAHMLKHGVVMDVTDAKQAQIARQSQNRPF